MLVAVDDAQWLDESSLGAILFAARRLFADTVALLVATRPGEAASRQTRPADARARGTRSGERRRGARAARREAAAARCRRPPVRGHARQSARARRAGRGRLRTAAATGTPAVETSVEHAFAPRIAALPEPARRLLALAAAEDSGELAVLGAGRVGARARARRRWTAAERAGLVAVALDRVVFCHPLARSAAYRSAPSDERRAAHRALAQRSTPDPDRRAWHHAAAAFGPDADAARRPRAGRRSGPAPAAPTPPPPRSLERAARLTDAPPDARAPAVRRRRGGLARRSRRAGDAAAGRGPRGVRGPRAAARDRPPARARRAALRAGHGRARHPRRARPAPPRRPEKAVVMLAEAADACVFAARPGPMLRAAAARLGGAAGRTPASASASSPRCALGMALIVQRT